MTTQERILETAATLIAEDGVRSVSFREVARRAGVSHQTPYHHFGNLQGILTALARQGFSELTASMRRAADAVSPDPLDRLQAAGTAYVRHAISHIGHLRVMFERSLVDVHECQLEEAAETYGFLTELVHTAHAHGYGAALDPEVLTHLCWSVVHGLTTLWVEGHLENKTPRTPEELDAHAAQVVEGLARLMGR